MKMAQGYVTDDGTFFESQTEATLHEEEMNLRAQLATDFPSLDQDKFLAIVFGIATQLRIYLDAHHAANTATLNQQAEVEDRGATNDSPQTTLDAGTGHVSSTEEDLTALLKLPTRGPSRVPDVGGGPSTKKVSDRRKVDGA